MNRNHNLVIKTVRSAPLKKIQRTCITFEKLMALSNVESSEGKSILHVAIQRGNIDVIEFVAQRYPNLINKKYQGKTPLQFVTEENSETENKDIITCLLSFGAKVPNRPDTMQDLSISRLTKFLKKRSSESESQTYQSLTEYYHDNLDDVNKKHAKEVLRTLYYLSKDDQGKSNIKTFYRNIQRFIFNQEDPNIQKHLSTISEKNIQNISDLFSSAHILLYRSIISMPRHEKEFIQQNKVLKQKLLGSVLRLRKRKQATSSQDNHPISQDSNAVLFTNQRTIEPNLYPESSDNETRAIKKRKTSE